jgi:hypothetical protein
MDSGQTERSPDSERAPAALRRAAHRPSEGGSTLVLDAGGQNVVVVLDEEGGDARLIWAFIRHQLSGRKTARM